MKNFIIAGVCLAAVAGFLTVVWLTNDGEGDSSQAAPEGPTRITNSLRSPQTIEESAAKSEVIARVRVLEQSEQLYGRPPTWEPASPMSFGLGYVWFRTEVLQYLKGEDLGKELILLDGGGPDVVVEGRVGAESGLSVGDEAVVFLGCDAPMPVEGDCWVMDAYIIEGGTARSPFNEKELPAADLEPRIEAALEAGADIVVGEQLAGGAGVLGGDEGDLTQDAEGT